MLLNIYLFDIDKTDEIEQELKESSIKIDKEIIENDKLEKIIIKLQTENATLEEAHKLDEINSYIIENLSPIVLSCGSSRYYNHELYPIINDMERNLRHLVYLANDLVGDKKLKKRLEDQNFNQIYGMLFTDSKFINKVHNLVGDRKENRKFSKEYLISQVENMDENVMWDEILKNDPVPSLRKNFRLAKDYRNSIMHAHNINKRDYINILELYNCINRELLEEIKMISASPEKEINKDIGSILSSALIPFKEIVDFSTTISQFANSLSTIKIPENYFNSLELPEYNIISPEFLEQIKRIQSMFNNKPNENDDPDEE